MGSQNEPSAELTVFFNGRVSLNPQSIQIAIVHGDEALLYQVDGVISGNNDAEFRAASAALDYATSRRLAKPTLAGDFDAVISALWD